MMDESKPTPYKWWLSGDVRSALLELGQDEPGHFVYNEMTITQRCNELTSTLKDVIKTFYYAMKANSHPKVLSSIAAAGFGMECVSIDEVRAVRALLSSKTDILFSPNFCPLHEYRKAFDFGAQIIVDDISIIKQDPDVFKGQKIAFRVDPIESNDSEVCHGHHAHVRTSGAGQKFGLPLSQLRQAAKSARQYGAIVVGLHVHVGSGILTPTVWGDMAQILSTVLLDETDVMKRCSELSDVEWIDLGGGLGVAGQTPEATHGVDLASIADNLKDLSYQLMSLHPPVYLHLEPGRYLVSEAGVLVTTVTQIRDKGSNCFLGVATGMNSLIRPALHDIINLSKAKQTWEKTQTNSYYDSDIDLKKYHVVGPICETADVLGHSRDFPVTTEVGDVILIANAGAYGHVMSCSYNMRAPASEVVLSMQ